MKKYGFSHVMAGCCWGVVGNWEGDKYKYI